MFRSILVVVAAAAALLAIALAASPASAAKKPSCTRDGAKLVFADGNVRVAKLKGKWLGCTVNTGKRWTVGSDNGSNELRFVMVQDRYLGVREYESGEVGLAQAGRVYDTSTRKLASSSAECDKFSIGDDIGPDAIVFLYNGGLAMTCDKLVLIRKAGAQAETLEAQGTKVSRLAASSERFQGLQTLYWIVTKDGQATTKSLNL